MNSTPRRYLPESWHTDLAIRRLAGVSMHVLTAEFFDICREVTAAVPVPTPPHTISDQACRDALTDSLPLWSRKHAPHLDIAIRAQQRAARERYRRAKIKVTADIPSVPSRRG